MKKFTFEEKSAAEKGFSVHFDKHIAPLLVTLEQKRLQQKTIYDKRKRLAFIGFPVSLLILGLINVALEKQDIFLVFSTLLLAGWFTWVTMPVRAFKDRYKRVILPRIVKFFGTFTYKTKGIIDRKRLEPFQLLASYDLYDSEDLFTGTYKKVSIEVAETHFQHRLRLMSYRRKVYKTVFKGLLIVLEMNKPFNGHTIIRRERTAVGNWLRHKNKKLENVTLEDPRFEKKFEVYSTDQVEARYLLTTAFMDRLLQLSELFEKTNKFFRNAPLEASFRNNKILIMIPFSKNLFESRGIGHSVYNINDIRLILKEMHLIFQIIDVLKLNKKLGF